MDPRARSRRARPALPVAPGGSPLSGQEALHRLLRPRSVLVVGASRDRRKYTGRPLRYLRLLGYDGDVGVVHSAAEETGEVGGYPTFPTVSAAAAAGAWDAALVLVPGPAVPEILRDLAAAGVGAAVVIADSADLDRDAVVGAGVTVLGPNTAGCFDLGAGSALSFLSALDEGLPVGGVGLFTQSGGVGKTIMNTLTAAGGGLATWAGTGDEWMIDLGSCMDVAVDLPQVTTVGLYFEGLPAHDDVAGRVRRLLDAGKPCGILTAGWSALARQVATTHTGKIASFSEATRELLSDAGAVLFSEPHELALWLASRPVARRRRAAIVSPQGGMAVVLADVVGEVVDVPAPSAALAGRLAESVPRWNGTLVVDTGLLAADRLRAEAAVVGAVLASGEVDKVVWLVMDPEHDLAALYEAVRPWGTRTLQRLVVCRTSYGRPAPPGPLERLREAGVQVAETPSDARARLRGPRPGLSGAPAVPEAQPLPAVPTGARLPAAVRRLLDAGVAFVPTVEVDDADAACAAAAALGWPVVLKLAPEAGAHKTEVGGVVVGIEDEDALRRAWKDLADLAPGPRWLQCCVAGHAELLLGYRRDPSIGGTVVVAAGGVLAELGGDIAYLPVHASDGEIERKLRRLRLAPLFDGYRNLPPVPLAPLVRMVAAVSALARCSPELTDLELNPVVATRDGVLALDVLAATGNGEDGDDDG